MSGRVLLFTGPAAAGKSTLAHAWASAQGDAITGCYDMDDARFLVKSGYVSRTRARKNPDFKNAADEQWRLAIRICEAVAIEYSRTGFDIAISGFRPPGGSGALWHRLDELSPIIVLVMASEETCVSRDTARKGNKNVGEDAVRRTFRHPWREWGSNPRAVVLDSDHSTIDDLVSIIDKHPLVERRSAN